jgi:hypothetical protein
LPAGKDLAMERTLFLHRFYITSEASFGKKTVSSPTFVAVAGGILEIIYSQIAGVVGPSDQFVVGAIDDIDRLLNAAPRNLCRVRGRVGGVRDISG